MKYAVLLLFGWNLLPAQIIFFNSYEKARAAAVDRDKGVFIQVCTYGHRKCKKMEEEVFSDYELSEILNLGFVNVRVDPGSDNAFTRKYQIKTIPTLIFLDKGGNEFSRVEGYKDASTISKAIKSNARKLGGLNDIRRNYLANRKDNDLLKEYHKSLSEAGFHNDARRLMTQFFYNLPEPETEEDLEFVFKTADHHRSASFQYVLTHLSTFDQTYGSVHVSRQLSLALTSSFNSEDQQDDKYVERRMKSVFREQGYDRFWDSFVVGQYASMDDTSHVDIFCQSGMNQLSTLNCSDMEYINDISVVMMLKNRDPHFLTQLKKQLQLCFDQTKDIPCLDLISVLTYRLGDTERSIQMVQEANQLAYDQNMKFVSSLSYFKKIGFIQ